MTLDEKIVEAAACAIFHAKPRNRIWDALPNEFKNQYRKQARAAITAFQAEAWQPRVTMPRDATISVVVAATDKNRTFAGRRDVLSVYIDSEGQFENDPENEFWAITHWQPLPNPPASP